MLTQSERTPEYDFSVMVLRLAAEKPGGSITLDELRQEIPCLMELTDADKEYSIARPGEQMWEQSLRNIQSHHATRTNFIHLGYLKHLRGGGYTATDEGRAFLTRLESEHD